MNGYLKASIACYGVFILLTTVFALVYLLRPEFMPYHAELLGRAWSELSGGEQGLILGLMRALGAAWLSLCLAMLVLLAWPFRQGENWSCWALPLVALPAEGVNLYVVFQMTLHTPASPPWEVVVFKALLLLIGFALSLAGSAKRQA